MSARDELIDILYGEGSPTGEREGDADVILAEHAHELAEKIRGECHHGYCVHLGRNKPCNVCDNSCTCEENSNLIDPEN